MPRHRAVQSQVRAYFIQGSGPGPMFIKPRFSFRLGRKWDPASMRPPGIRFLPVDKHQIIFCSRAN